jgi:hypothetical protein
LIPSVGATNRHQKSVTRRINRVNAVRSSLPFSPHPR